MEEREGDLEGEIGDKLYEYGVVSIKGVSFEI